MKTKTAPKTRLHEQPKRRLTIDEDSYLELSSHFMGGDRQDKITVIKIGQTPVNGWQVFIRPDGLIFFSVEHLTLEDFEQWKGTEFYDSAVDMHYQGSEPEVLIFWQDSDKIRPIDFVEIRDFSGDIQFSVSYPQ